MSSLILPVSSRWRRSVLGPASSRGNEGLALRIAATLEPAALDRALRRLMRRHDALRLVCGEAPSDVSRHAELEPPSRRISLDVPESQDRDLALRQLLADCVREPCSTAGLPGWRVFTIDVAPGDSVLLLVANSVFCDAWSLTVVAEQLAAAYFEPDSSWQARAAPPQFADYLSSEHSEASAELRARANAHWFDVHQGTWPALQLARAAMEQNAGEASAEWSRAKWQAFVDLCARLRVSSFAGLAGLWAAWIARVTGSERATVVVPVADQAVLGQPDLVGACSHDVLISLPLSSALSAGQYLHRVQQMILDAEVHRHAGVESLAESLAAARDLPFPLTRMRLDPEWAPELTAWRGSRVVPERLRAESSFTLDLLVQVNREGLSLRCTHDGSGEQTALAQRGLRFLTHWAEALVADSEQMLLALPLLDEAEANRVRYEWAGRSTVDSGTQVPAVDAWIATRSAMHPDATAWECAGAKLTNSRLDTLAGRVAHELRSRGVGEETRVAILLERSPELLAAVLGVLRCGACFVPLDPDYPPARLQFMVDDSGASLVLSSAALLRGLGFESTTPMLDFEQISTAEPAAPAPVSHRAGAACLIYTSGSTGTPKGVVITHRALCNHFEWLQQELGLCSADRVLQYTSVCFDAALVEMLAPLCVGATIVAAPPGMQRDFDALAALVAGESVTFLQSVPTTLRALLGVPAFRRATGLRVVVSGGEALSWDLARDFALVSEAQLVNCYGPTETTIDAASYRVPRLIPEPTRGELRSAYVPIGRPIRNAECYVLDRELRLVPPGVPGELHIGGAGVSPGYWRRPELTAERFVAHPFREGARLYKSGDSVRFAADGNLEYLGRIDDQVKIRGFRVEIGEVEAALRAASGGLECVVAVREDRAHQKQLVAYLVAPRIDQTELSMALRACLAEHMVPSAFVTLTALPLLPNGKVNRAALPRPAATRPELSVPYEAAQSSAEAAVCAAFAGVLGIDRVGRRDNFFDLGGNSILAVEVLDRIAHVTGKRLSAPTIFAKPSAAQLAAELEGGALTEAKPTRPKIHPAERAREGIAIIGMAGRFPGANSIEAFWSNLLAGADSITDFGEADLDPSIDPKLRRDSNYVRARGVIDAPELFDAAFFGMTAREAELTDPQQRVFLEIAWECLERAGYAPGRCADPVAVFAGVDTPTYLIRNLYARPELIEAVGELQVTVGNDKDYVATRVANRLDLKGPAIAVNTACSTSLVAVIQAVDALRAGRCWMALAGGASIHAPPAAGYLHQEGAMLSPDGRTRTFDADARGTSFNDGAAVVLLKRLSDALDDGDRVYAVIRGVGINNDGGGKASFTAPSVDGQTAAIVAAHAEAGVDPEAIGYVEAHGTATPLGDPIEIEALTRAFRRGSARTGFCRIGSVKSNVGHLVAAAGAAGLIKAALALDTGILPASIHYRRPNPRIDFGASPFRVADERSAWPRGARPRYAGVSSFGVGGTNAHVVIEEPPLQLAPETQDGETLLRLSARTPTALAAMAERLAQHLEAGPELRLADVAHTLRVGRTRFAQRMSVVAATTAQAVAALRGRDGVRKTTRSVPQRRPDVVFLFPGQASHYAGMGSGAFAAEPLFRHAFEAAVAKCDAYLDFDLRAAIFDGGAARLTDTAVAQPAIFCLEYALASMWVARGVAPVALIGHSLGEFAAAVIAGVMSVEDAARLVCCRGRLMQAQEPGAMLSVRASLLELEPLLPQGVELAAENAPQACVVSGPSAEIAAFAARLADAGIAARALVTSHAFHSAMMDRVLEPFGIEVAGVRLAPPAIPIISTVTGTWMTPAQATDPVYWTTHLRRPVRFSPAVFAALAREGIAFLETGPRAMLSTLARQHVHAGAAAPIAIASLGDDVGLEAATLVATEGALWTLGIELEPAVDAPARRLPLPTYPFERRRCWIDPPRAATLAQIEPVVDVPANATLPVPDHTGPAGPAATENAPMSESIDASKDQRRLRLAARLIALIEEVAGIDLGGTDPTLPFVELGLDSLTLTQAAQQVKRAFGVPVTFRQLMETYRSVAALADHLDTQLPPEPVVAPPAPGPAPALGTSDRGPVQPMQGPALPASLPAVAGAGNALQQLIQQQMALMSQQLALLAGGAPAASITPAASAAAASVAPVAHQGTVAASAAEEPTAPVKYDVKKAFGAIARINTQDRTVLTDRQQARLGAFIKRYVERTRSSKAFTQQHRAHMADPRVVNGFRPQIKEMIYQIVINRSEGPYLWDLDGNRYVDALGGFGMCLFGWRPAFVQHALREQLELGYEIGPMHPLAADVAKLICEISGFERSALVNTGSEAVMGAIRIARTATARNTIVTFTGSYHGTFDEVLVRSGRGNRGIPAAPGIMPCMFGEIVVLEYGADEALERIRAIGNDVAAVVVEPVQSRRPEFQPRDFLLRLRALTAELGICLIFDEVITGFRAAPGGAQEIFGVRADLATYGKVIGGGLPIGAIAGTREFMDALDGGTWQYGDDSMPTVGVTYLAGTFVRHPLAMAAAKAALEHMKQQGPTLQRDLNARVAVMVDAMNAHCRRVGAPIEVRSFASLWRVNFSSDHPWQDLLFAMMRSRGIHILDNFPNYMTTAHGEAEIAAIVDAFQASVDELLESEFMPRSTAGDAPELDSSRPPLPGARLGRDEHGKPAWFVPNPDRKGAYLKVEA
jgi:amino acid adenylation domain-containing protein